jgi:DNA-binding NtrC family response regulator
VNQILIVDDSPTKRWVHFAVSTRNVHAGFCAHVPKPFEPDNLLSTIARAVQSAV